MRTKAKKADKFGWEGVNGLYLKPTKDYDISYIEISVVHPKRKNTKNSRLYLVVDGEVEFNINEEKQKLVKGDYVFVPKNTAYSYKPKSLLKLVEINNPPFDKSSEIVLK